LLSWVRFRARGRRRQASRTDGVVSALACGI
jgi:hypothetical protein